MSKTFFFQGNEIAAKEPPVVIYPSGNRDSGSYQSTDEYEPPRNERLPPVNPRPPQPPPQVFPKPEPEDNVPVHTHQEYQAAVSTSWKRSHSIQFFFWFAYLHVAFPIAVALSGSKCTPNWQHALHTWRGLPVL